ncbi:hypothetical protein THOM_0669 [Trachipleistophora hominis]|uniref:Uncharacterized protein n=1 Tax=Trachipleistophora hominis TaxID=72359 RepID=L7K009_TRAHO|nr:hypothetical protein THOM_0669 [Trachipleistophora hominis]
MYVKIRKQKQVYKSATAAINALQSIINKKNLFIVHEKTKHAFMELKRKYTKRDLRSKILNKLQVCIKVFANVRLSYIRYNQAFVLLYWITLYMELLSGFMCVILVQEDLKYLLEQLEDNVECYSVLINEIIGRPYEAHHRGEWCLVDRDMFNDLIFIVTEFITEYKSENVFWLEQGVVVGKYAHVYDSWFLESWFPFTVDDLNQWTDTMDNRFGIYKFAEARG